MGGRREELADCSLRVKGQKFLCSKGFMGVHDAQPYEIEILIGELIDQRDSARFAIKCALKKAKELRNRYVYIEIIESALWDIFEKLEKDSKEGEGVS